MKGKGFTLLELVVAIGVMGILFALAIPGLQSQTRSLHRFAAETKLLAWQASGTRPIDGPQYHYHKLKDRLIATTDKPRDCSELVLTPTTQMPANCWPRNL